MTRVKDLEVLFRELDRRLRSVEDCLGAAVIGVGVVKGKVDVLRKEVFWYVDKPFSEG